jgi:hypothetical protein
VKDFAGPRATRLIRDLVCEEVLLDLRNDDADILELPSNFTKRGLYNRYLQENGWVFKFDSKCRVIEKILLEEGLVQPVSWPTFWNFWCKNYPKLVVPNAAEDICNECVRFANQHKFALMSKGKDEEGKSNSDTEDDNQEEPNDDVAEQRMRDNEELILKAAAHVEMAQQQRLYFQQKRKEAIDTCNKRPSEWFFVLLATMRRTCPYQTLLRNSQATRITSHP